MSDPRHPFEISHGIVSYSFPLATGETAQLMLPERLTDEDAERLADYIAALVIPAAGEDTSP